MPKQRLAELVSSDSDKQTGLGLVPNLVAFIIGLAIAYFYNWEVRDLVWSLWLCSLTLGYLIFLAAIGAETYASLQAMKQKDLKKEQRLPAILAVAGIGLFFLAFFSLHFGAFHAGHSVFLQGFFPVAGMPSDGFGRAFMNPFLLWILVFRHLIAPYGLFLIPTIIVERQVVFKPLMIVVQKMRAGEEVGFLAAGSKKTAANADTHHFGEAMFKPYVNVVRMHLLIFFFAICYALNVQSFIVFAAVYFVYFFPWSEIKKYRTLKKSAKRRSA